MGRYNKGVCVAVFGLSLFLFQIAVIGTLLAGWVFNLIALIDCDFEAPYKAEIIRGVGVVAAPVGGVVGYFDIEDGENVEDGEPVE